MAGGYPRSRASDEDYIGRELYGLRADLAEGRGSNGLESFNIKDGGGTVQEGAIESLDANGDPQARFGKLESGGHGMELLVGGQWAPLAALFGAKAISVPTPTTLGNTSGDSGWQTDGASVTFTTYTGRFLLLLVSGSHATTNGYAWMGFSTTGATTIEPSEDRSAISMAFESASAIGSAVYSEVINGNPGEVTVTPRYRRAAIGSGTGDSQWRNRSTIVFPF